MSYTVEEFNPKKPVLIIDSTEVVISLITLHKEVSFKAEYGSLTKMFEKLKETPTIIIKVLWELVLDKSQFENSFKVFEQLVLTSKESLVDVSKKMTACLNDSTAKSMPLIKNQKRYKELQEINKTQNEGSGEPCYVVYFDTVSKRYGKSIDEFYNLTLCQLHLLLKVIGDKTYEELEVQAALQGKKLRPRTKFEDISEEQEADNEEQAMEALKELQRKYKERTENKGE